MPGDTMLRFPDGFLWGTATASVQIEGAAKEGGKGESIWDRFASTRATSTTAHPRGGLRPLPPLPRRLRPDGVAGAPQPTGSPSPGRASFPDGDGAVNPAGLDFYDRLVDAMLERGIRPFATLYHWDLPQALQERGGWANRATVDAFVRLRGRVTVGRLGDRVKDWMTHNEPWVSRSSGTCTASTPRA